MYQTPLSHINEINVLDFIAEVTAHSPPKSKQYIRSYGLYSSRTKDKWKENEYMTRLVPSGWKAKHDQKTAEEASLPNTKECSPDEKKRK